MASGECFYCDQPGSKFRVTVTRELEECIYLCGQHRCRMTDVITSLRELLAK